MEIKVDLLEFVARSVEFAVGRVDEVGPVEKTAAIVECDDGSLVTGIASVAADPDFLFV